MGESTPPDDSSIHEVTCSLHKETDTGSSPLSEISGLTDQPAPEHPTVDVYTALGNRQVASNAETEHAELSNMETASQPDDTCKDKSETHISVTESQYQSIVHPALMDQLLRIRAGPGSGKTFTLVARIAQLLKNGALPEEILVLSMANKSVDSLKDSLQNLVGPAAAARVDVSTFHSFCGGLLDQYGPSTLPNYTKLKTFDAKTWKNMTRIFSGKSIKLNGHGIGATVSPSRFGNMLSQIFSGKSVSDAVAPFGVNDSYVQGVMQYLSRNGFARYDELLGRAIHMMNTVSGRPDAAQAMPRLSGYKYVFVDEFQDIYPHLIRVINAIANFPTSGCAAGAKKHLTIAGDPNQSIYGFLGTNHGDMQNIEGKFRNYEIKDVFIRESFRCTQEILDGATHVCLHDSQAGSITTRAYSLGKPVVFRASSSIAEQQFVANEIIRLVCESGGLIRLGDIAILTRSNDSALSMQSLLKTSFEIPSVKLSQGNLWIETSLHLYKDVLSVIAGDSDSSFSLMSVLQHIDRSRGSSVRLAKIFNQSMQDANAQDPLFLEAHLFDELSRIAEETEATQNRSKTAGSYIKGLYRNTHAVLETLVQFLNIVQKERSYITEVRQKGPLAYGPVELVESLARIALIIGTPHALASDSAQARKATSREALESFNNSLHHSYSKYIANDEVHASSFLDYFLQTYDQEVPDGSSNSVKISTIHSAKGLEFPVVFILGQTQFSSYWDGLLDAPRPEAKKPGQDSFLHNGHEETPSDSNARLLYVAMTRARNLVYLGCRKQYGDLSHTAKESFAEGLPDLHAYATERAAAPFQETLAGRLTSEMLPNRESRRGCMEDAGGREPERGFVASTCSHGSSVLQALAQDLKRGVPTPHKLDLGTGYYKSFCKLRIPATSWHVSTAKGGKFVKKGKASCAVGSARRVLQMRSFSTGLRTMWSGYVRRTLKHVVR